MRRNKSSPRRILIPAIAIILVLAALPVVFLYPGYRHRKMLSKRVELLKADIKALGQKNRKLREEIEALKKDSFYLEKLAREMGLVKEGEIVYKVTIEEEENEGESGKSETSEH